ncbi:MAG TPA: dihydrodipicolinate synthase family protein [Chloroflexi bacterium]|jgi:4-hydroxy-tetrahydrodipicolinate synthase|nr:dihydrodipicolinate synthase family protein [Chloroflexota bacterium]
MATFERLQGIIPALATPLNDDETIDEAALRKLVRHVLDAGVHGVVVLGTAGEFAALTDAEKERAVEVVVSEVAGQVPVIAGTGEPATRRAVETTRRMAALGIDAAMVVPPYYQPIPQSAVLAHYCALVAATDLPIALYNIPSCTKITLEVDTVRALAHEPGIVGLKDSSGQFAYFQTLADELGSEQFGLVMGSDGLVYASLAVGGNGSIGSGINIAPHWYVALWDAARAGRWDEARDWQRRIAGLSALYRYGFHPGLKAVLSLLGICRPVVTAPMQALSGEQLQDIEAMLREMQLL